MDTRRATGRCALALAPLLLALLAACGGDDPPIADPPQPTGSSSGATTSESTSPPSQSQSPTSGSTSSGPVAQEFIQTWLQARNAFLSSGDAAPFSPMNASNCIYCNTLIDGVTKIYSEGGRVEGGLYKPAENIRQSGEKDSSITYTLTVTNSNTVAYDKSGSVIQQVDGVTDAPRFITLLRTDDGFKTLDFGEKR